MSFNNGKADMLNHILQVKNLIDQEYGLKMFKLFRIITEDIKLDFRLIKWLLIYLLIFLQNNLELNILISCLSHLSLKNVQDLKLPLTTFLIHLTGLLRDLLLLLKIKEIVVLAGLSQLLDLFKVLTTTKIKNFSLSQSNNQLTVQKPMEMKDAMEVICLGPSGMSLTTESPLKINTLTQQKHNHANIHHQ